MVGWEQRSARARLVTVVGQLVEQREHPQLGRLLVRPTYGAH